MSTTHEIEPGRTLDLSQEVVGVDHGDRRARIVEQEPRRPPKRIDGFTVGAPMLTGDAPHDGEMHPDGDEVLHLVSGRVRVELELPDGERTVELGPGDGLVVPRGCGTASGWSSPACWSTSPRALAASTARSPPCRRPAPERLGASSTPQPLTSAGTRYRQVLCKAMIRSC